MFYFTPTNVQKRSPIQHSEVVIYLNVSYTSYALLESFLTDGYPIVQGHCNGPFGLCHFLLCFHYQFAELVAPLTLQARVELVPRHESSVRENWPAAFAVYFAFIYNDV